MSACSSDLDEIDHDDLQVHIADHHFKSH
jgi:hypothetical protein